MVAAAKFFVVFVHFLFLYCAFFFLDVIVVIVVVTFVKSHDIIKCELYIKWKDFNMTFTPPILSLHKRLCMFLSCRFPSDIQFAIHFSSITIGCFGAIGTLLWLLYDEKWFTYAIDANIFISLSLTHNHWLTYSKAQFNFMLSYE